MPKAIEAVWKIKSTRLIGAIARVTHRRRTGPGRPALVARPLELRLACHAPPAKPCARPTVNLGGTEDQTCLMFIHPYWVSFLLFSPSLIYSLLVTYRNLIDELVDGRILDSNPCFGEQIKLHKNTIPVASAMDPDMDESIHRAK